MATGFDFKNNKWVFTDGKLNVQDWINETPGIRTQWEDACRDRTSDAPAILLFDQWVAYAGAVKAESLPQT